MVDAIERPDSSPYYDVILLWDLGAEQRRWTNWSNPVAGYDAVPEMEIRFPKNDGTVTPQELQLDVDVTDVTEATLTRFASGGPISEISISILETIESPEPGDTTSRLHHFRGRVHKILSNVDGRQNRMRLICHSAKSQLEGQCGLQCNVTCEFRLFGPGCATGDGFGNVGPDGQPASGPQWGLESRVVAVTARTGRVLQITPGWYASSPLRPNASLRNGVAERNGLRIDIFDWDVSNPNDVILTKAAPDDWVGQNVRFYPGCDNTAASCDVPWGNLDNFGAYGIGMPDYDPTVFEE